jgi:phospholipid/cholesterol/gamma-HCH transport system permease protein
MASAKIDETIAAGAPRLTLTQEREGFVLRAGGEWMVGGAAELDARLSLLTLPSGERVILDLSQIDRLDTAGAWLLLRTERRLLGRGNRVELRGLRPVFAPLLSQLRASSKEPPASLGQERAPALVAFLARIGEMTLRLLRRGVAMLGFFGLVTVTAAALLRHPRRLRLVATVAQMEHTGVNALPIVGLLSFLIGIVIAYQGYDQLRRFGAEIYTVNLLAVGILRELGVLMTAIILAGRSGSAFTAQIGTMRVTEEIDAMRAIGLDPVEVLVIPRLLALLFTLPMLTLFADFMGIVGGAFLSAVALGIPAAQFVTQLHSALSPSTFWIGLVKAPFFAAIIALIGCYEGFQVSRSAESVGRLTTLSVVEAIFFVIVTDAAFSILFSVLKI